MIRGMISDIQRFSLHDGPGIRTTVFLKGCNLQCSWCHNPETIHAHRELAFYPNSCIGCKSCYDACKTGALRLKNNQRVYDSHKCIHCGDCAESCPTGALIMVGKEMTPQECFEKLRADEDYYRYSDHGGVTVSGGEPLMQAAFVKELLCLCKDAGYDTAIETNLSFPFETIEMLLPYLDRIFCDLKVLDNEAHIAATAHSNVRILENLAKLSAYDIPVVVRTPLIPGVTDSRENIEGIAKWLKENAKIHYYELLNYNPLAEAKHTYISREYLHTGDRPLEKLSVRDLVALANAQGVYTVCWEE